MRKTLKDSGSAPVSWTPRLCHVLRAPSRAAAPLHTVHDALYEAGWPCQVVVCLSKCLGCACSRSRGGGRWSREVPSALYSRSSRARGTRRRMRGFEGWGRHLRSGPAAAAKATFALTHPSTLREISPRIVRASSTRSHGPHGGCRRSGMTRMPNALRFEHAAIAQQRIKDSGEATGEGDDGHLGSAARCDAQGPGPQFLRLRRGGAEGWGGGLDSLPIERRAAG